jgi:hypothetical protein
MSFSSFFGKKASVAAPSGKAENFDLEAEKLFAQLNLPSQTGGVRTMYNPMDPIW